MIQQKNYCPNFNHSRSNSPVRFCPTCGEIVNEKVLVKKCNEEIHGKMRRDMNKFCVDCGEKLRKG